MELSQISLSIDYNREREKKSDNLTRSFEPKFCVIKLQMADIRESWYTRHGASKREKTMEEGMANEYDKYQNKDIFYEHQCSKSRFDLFQST